MIPDPPTPEGPPQEEPTDSTSSPPPPGSAGHGCCVEGDCTPSTCMELPAGTTCGDCFHIARCKAIFGHVETDTYCDWFPRRFVAKDPALAAENSWHRFCLQKDERPEMWPAKIKMIKTVRGYEGLPDGFVMNEFGGRQSSRSLHGRRSAPATSRPRSPSADCPKDRLEKETRR